MDADNEEAMNLPSVAIQMLTHCEQHGLGKMGVTLFAHDVPDMKNTEQKHCFCFIDTSPGNLARLLNGNISCQREFFTLFCKHKSEKDARTALFPFTKVLRKVMNTQIENVMYMSIHPLIPIHFVGKDKNDRYTCEVTFSVLRRYNLAQ